MKSRRKKNNDAQDERNVGVTYNYWYVAARYASLKAELLTNSVCCKVKTVKMDMYY